MTAIPKRPKRAICVAAVIAIALSVGNQGDAAVPCTAFVDVTVVATDHAALAPRQTVVVQGSRIERRGSSLATQGCAVIDGHDKYLIPGLVDTHVHLFGYRRGGEGDPATERAVLQMLLANGVTTAVVMEGSLATLKLRADVASGRVEGPTLYSAGLLIQGPDTGAPPMRKTFTTPAEVRAEVQAEKRLGYDFVKVHGAMSRETYAALLATAREEGMPVVGHVPDNLGLDAALTGGQRMIAHAESYLQTFFEFNRELPTDPAEIDAMVADAARRTAQAGVFVQPTLSVFRQIIDQIADPDAFLQRPEAKLMTPVSVREWQPDINPYLIRWSDRDLPRFRAQYRIMQRLVRGLHDAGVPILVGTDPMVPVQLPGFSVRDEMEQLQEAGLRPFDVLQAATFNAARFLGQDAKVGQVRPGFAADLVLLDANPLDDVSNVFRQAGVMLGGRFHSENEIQTSLWALAKDR